MQRAWASYGYIRAPRCHTPLITSSPLNITLPSVPSFAASAEGEPSEAGSPRSIAQPQGGSSEESSSEGSAHRRAQRAGSALPAAWADPRWLAAAEWVPGGGGGGAGTGGGGGTGLVVRPTHPGGGLLPRHPIPAAGFWPGAPATPHALPPDPYRWPGTPGAAGPLGPPGWGAAPPGWAGPWQPHPQPYERRPQRSGGPGPGAFPHAAGGGTGAGGPPKDPALQAAININKRITAATYAQEIFDIIARVGGRAVGG